MNRIKEIIIFIVIIVFGYNYILQPDICNKNFCSGDVVFVPSENRTAYLSIGELDYYYNMTNVNYYIPVTSEYWPGMYFYSQTKHFEDLELIIPNPETCNKRYYVRQECK